MSCNIVVLASGSGSNLQAIMDQIADNKISGRISAVLCNRPEAYALERAKKAGIPTIVLDHKSFDSRPAFDKAMIEAIDPHKPELIVLAGFMRILTPEFCEHYLGRMINIHPALLPSYKGLNTHQRVLDAGESVHGCTVHFVTPDLDDGPNIIQAVVDVTSEDNAETLVNKVQQQEHIIYPQAVAWFAEGRIKMIDQRTTLDEKPLGETGYVVDSRT